jgi:hypothetical protein
MKNFIIGLFAVGLLCIASVAEAGPLRTTRIVITEVPAVTKTVITEVPAVVTRTFVRTRSAVRGILPPYRTQCCPTK